jgi:hypothetical protein
MEVTVFGGVAAQTFGSGGAGFAIVQLMLIAAFGALSSYIASALGQGQVASMIKMVAVFSCIAIVIHSVWKAIAAVAQAFGIQL